MALLSTLVCAGCGNKDEGPITAPATGSVTYNGKPVAGATVTFQPVTTGKGQTCQVQADENGKFVMLTSVPGGKSKEGALPGEYRVTVIKQELEPGQMAPKNYLPARYMSAAKSKLTATVVAGQDNEFDLQLND